jgi:predicted MFS family arabinose efflux permease
MVLAGPAVQQAVPAGLRGLAGGLVFVGVGTGIVIGAVLVPALVPWGLPQAWLALAALTLVLTVFSWTRWPDVPPPPPMALPRMAGPSGRLIAAYGCAAVAQTAHMVWWPDFIARGLGHAAGTGAALWALYGVAAMVGAPSFGRLADRIGAAPALSLAMCAQALALLLPLVTGFMPLLALSAICAGATAIGMTVLTLARARELEGDQAMAVWRLCTATFGLSQTVTGFAMAFLYAATGGHAAIFALGLAAALAGLWLSRHGLHFATGQSRKH